MAGNQRLETKQFEATAAQYDKVTGGCTRDVARQLLALPQLLSSSPCSILDAGAAVILDSACGTGIVAEEILALQPNARIMAVDAGPNMVQMAESKPSLAAAPNVTFGVMPGEKLDFPDSTFTHSITNLGILFYKSAADGARELYRTLKPGGVAVVTSWSSIGYLEAIQATQEDARPHDEPFKLPVSEEWLKPSHVERVMKENGGFPHVEMLTRKAHFGAATKDELVDIMIAFLKGILWSSLPEDGQEAFKEAVRRHFPSRAVPYTMIDGRPGFGYPLEAIVAVCRKD
jgi:ubiquinone/menaquinone biosynthesis C-methylase UbiE